MAFSRRQLIDAVWGPTWVGDEHLVDVHIGHLRRKLGDDAGRRPVRAHRPRRRLPDGYRPVTAARSTALRPRPGLGRRGCCVAQALVLVAGAAHHLAGRLGGRPEHLPRPPDRGARRRTPPAETPARRGGVRVGPADLDRRRAARRGRRRAGRVLVLQPPGAALDRQRRRRGRRRSPPADYGARVPDPGLGGEFATLAATLQRPGGAARADRDHPATDARRPRPRDAHPAGDHRRAPRGGRGRGPDPRRRTPWR